MNLLNKICFLIGLILFILFLTTGLALAEDTSCRGGAGGTLSAGVNSGSLPEYYGIGSYANNVTCGPSNTYTCPAGNTTKIYIWYDTESGYDKVKIYNGAGTLLEDISGSGGYIWKGPYSSNTLKFGFTSDGSVTKTGFDIWKIECVAAACKSNGTTCSAGSECCSGNCINGYCCNSACSGNCDRCNIAGSLGTCTNVDADCTGNCDYCNAGNCAANNASCSNTDASCYCSGSGTSFNCQTCADCKDCSAYTCSPTTEANDGTCNDDCTYCNAGTCTNRPAGATDECSASYACNTAGGDCTFFTTCNGRTAYSNTATLSPTTSWQTTASSLASGTDTKRYAVNITTAGTHEFSFCPADGGAAGYDSYLCLLNSAGTQLTYDDDACSPASKISYNFTSTGTYYIQVSGYLTNYGTYTLAYRRIPPNQAPSISSVTDSPDPVTVGSATAFSITWSDPNSGDNTKIHICKTNAISGQTCSGGNWCETTSWSTSSPTSCSYTPTISDVGTQNYYAFTCDDDNACSSSISGTFSAGTTCNARTALADTATLSPTTSWQTATANSLASGTDTKRYKITVSTTGTHDFSLCSADGGAASYDSYLCLLDSAGTQLTYNDDSCGTQSKITYNFTSTGTYYLQVSGYSTNYGTYTLAFKRRKIATQIPSADFGFDPSTITLGQQTAVRGWLKMLDGTGVGGQTLTLKYYGADSNYHDISPSQSGSTSSVAPNIGYMSFYWTPSSTYLGEVSYRLEFAENSTYESSVSSAKNLIVNQPVCSAPGNFRSSTITEKTVKILWDAVSGASLYKVEWCENGKIWGSADCCPNGTCNITTSDVQTTAPDLMYNTIYNFRVRVNTATGCITPGNWAEVQATTSWPECGAGPGLKGDNCGFSYAYIGDSCIVGGLDNHGFWAGAGKSECYDANTVARRDMCPAPSNLSVPETLLKLGEFNDGAVCNVNTHWKGLTCSTRVHAGLWDKSEYKCVRCSGKFENQICGDPTQPLGIFAIADVDTCTKAGDSQCEAACGANSFCDEKINSHYYKTSEIRLDWCLDCFADYTLCDTYTECDSSDPENFGEDFRCYYTAGGYHWGSSASVPATETECSDGHDNDCDGYTDCDPTWPDPDCPCDTTPPTSKILSIKNSAGTDITTSKDWLKADTYTITIEDYDNVGGSGLNFCQLGIFDATVGSWAYKTRACNSPITFIVADPLVNPFADCKTQNNASSCGVWTIAWDKVALISNAKDRKVYTDGNYRYYGADWTPPTAH